MATPVRDLFGRSSGISRKAPINSISRTFSCSSSAKLQKSG